MARRLVDVPTLQDALIKVADTVPLAGDIVGPAGFLERLGWYREMLADTLAARRADVGTAAAPVWAREGFHRPIGQRPCGRRSASRPRARWAAARRMRFLSAAGLEMLHNAFLVHDDIEDGSDSRRGVATMHRRAGVPIAVNTGDAMNALAMRLFRKTRRAARTRRWRCASSTKSITCSSRRLEGQAIELGWVRDNDLTVRPDDYLRLVLKKTAWYSFIHPMRIGALVANGDDQNLDRFDRFGYLLGLAFPDHRRRP